MNRSLLVGRLTKNVELKSTQSGIYVVTFTIAVNRSFRDENGEAQADFIQCVVWRKQAENLAKYCGKGSLIGIDGRIQTRQYDTNDGTRYVTEVVCDSISFLESKKQDQQEQHEDPEEDISPYDFVEKKVEGVDEEDLPF